MKDTWIMYVAQRFARVDRTGRGRATSQLSIWGIAFGVAALIVIMSVMNGFQMGSIESILEISSYHLRAYATSRISEQTIRISEPVEESVLTQDQLSAVINAVPDVRSCIPLYEAQTLFAGRGGRQRPGLLRGVPADVLTQDVGFSEQISIDSGRFDISKPGTVVLGTILARSLGVRQGDTVNLLALSGGSSTDLFDTGRTLTVTGLVSCSYSDINATFAFVSLETARNLLGQNVEPIYGIKLRNSDHVDRVMARLQHILPDLQYESWRVYNRSFFGALRVEKNLLMLTALLIFVVVGVTIFNAMRRMVYQKHEEIAVLKALGASRRSIQTVFMYQGLRTGFMGAVPGLVAGLLISVRLSDIMELFTKIGYSFVRFFTLLFSPGNVQFLESSSVFLYYAAIPARVFFSEAALITLFGVLASFTAAWAASRSVAQMSVAEVLHDE